MQVAQLYISGIVVSPVAVSAACWTGYQPYRYTQHLYHTQHPQRQRKGRISCAQPHSGSVSLLGQVAGKGQVGETHLQPGNRHSLHNETIK